MFENETKVDLETNMRASKRLLRNIRIGFALLGVLMLGIGIALLLAEILVWKKEDYTFDFFFILFGAFMLLLAIFFKPFIRRTTKKTMQGKEGVNLFRFSEEGYEVATTLNDGTTGTTQGNYNAFTQCKEFPEFWLLYLNKATYFIVEKSGMKTGTAEELAGFLIGKLGGKYKVCCKKK